MQIIVEKEILSKGIQIVQNAISLKSSLPVLNNILIEGKKNGIKLTATDLELCISSFIPATVEIEGAITVPAKKFFDIIRYLPDNVNIDISKKKSNFITIKSEKSLFKIVGLPKEEFPDIPIFEENKNICIEQKKMKEILNLTDFAMSKDDPRYFLNGLYFCVTDKEIEVVATDGKRLAVKKENIENIENINEKVIIPSKTIQEIKKILLDEGDVIIKFSKNQILFKINDNIIVSKLIEGDYPNYNNVIPRRSSKKVIINKEDFLSSARRATIFIDKDSVGVKLNINKRKMIISKTTPYLGELKEEVNIEYTGSSEIEIGFNPMYLIDILKVLPSNQVSLEVIANNKPGTIRLEKENYIYVILPINLSKE